MKKVEIREYIKNNILYLDGGMGTILQSYGLELGELPETWNFKKADTITNIHREYFNAGSNVVNTNTFGANTLKFSEAELEEIIKSAIENAKTARDTSTGKQEKFIALDIGPTGKMLKPLGDLDFEDAVNIFAKTVSLGVKYGADLIFIETMNDSYETKAALLAAKENSTLPVFVSNAYDSDGKLMTGADALTMVTLLEGLGADAIGVNCSLGPKALSPIVEDYLKYSSLPVILKPNAGLPKSQNGKTVYDILPDEFLREVLPLVKKGVRIVGGCCGTTPEYIKKIAENTKDILPVPTVKKDMTCVCSYTHSVVFSDKPVLIGERINPTGKKRLKQALAQNDLDYILKEGIKQQESGADVLDVNVGLPEIDEEKMLKNVVCELQSVSDLPLQIDTSDISAMETALRIYNGKALINSVNGKKESMSAVFPLAKKYGGLVVALTLDENGIPSTAEQRLNIAKNILIEAEKYGIDKKNIIFDPLALTISTDTSAAKVTLDTVELIKGELGCKTVLGVSNISFGLPQRDFINSTFFACALTKGLSSAIINPLSFEMMKAYRTYCALNGLDALYENYIDFAQSVTQTTVSVTPQNEKAEYNSALKHAIAKGLKEQSSAITSELLKEKDPIDIINDEIIPALDNVGLGFENKTVYLPQLLMSAEAAKSAFETIKSSVENNSSDKKCTVILATVKGDIHDIGKNIVKLLLQNYGFDVIDLGKDVSPEIIVQKTVETHAPIVGLSALMTTTVKSMEETIKALRVSAPFCKVVVGGAVLNKEYADAIGADKYSKDAMETVRYAEQIVNQK